MRRLGLAAIVVFALARSAFALDIIGGASSVTTANVTGNMAGDVSGTLTNNAVNQLHLNATTVSGVSSYAMVSTDVIVACDATGQAGGVAVTLQQNLGGTVTPDTFLIKVDSTTNCCSIAPFSGDTLNGGSTAISICGQGDAVKLFPTSVSTWMGQEQATAAKQVVTAITGTGTYATGAVNWIPIGGSVITGASEAVTQVPIASAGLWKNLRCFDATALSGTMSVTMLLRDGAATGNLTCAISVSGTTCSDLTHTFINAAGDLMDLQVTPANTPTAAGLRCSMEFYPF